MLALLGAGLWLGHTLVLIVRGGVAPYPQLETVTFGVGFAAFTAAAGLVAWASARNNTPAVRALLIVMAGLAVPLVVLMGQVALFALPGSHWLESDVIVIVLGAAGLVWGVRELRRMRQTRS